MESSKDKTKGFAGKLVALTFLISFTLLLAGGFSQPAHADENGPIEAPEIINLLDGIDISDGVITAVVGDSFLFNINDVKAIPVFSGTKYCSKWSTKKSVKVN